MTRHLTARLACAAVLAISADDVWAVGRLGTETLIEHWDGSSWTRI